MQQHDSNVIRCKADPQLAMWELLQVLLLVLLPVCGIGQPVTYDWALPIGNGTGGDDLGMCVTTDALNNSYVTGSFTGVVDFDPSSAQQLLIGTTTVVNTYDIFVAKYDATGAYVWAFGLGNTQQNRGNSVVVDASGNVYVTGFFYASLDFDPSPATAVLSGTLQEIFIAKYDGSGNFIWAKNIGNATQQYGSAIALDPGGNILITGVGSGTLDFDPGPGVANVVGAGSGDIFIAKYDSNGNFIWAGGMGSLGNDQSTDLVVDGTGASYITGSFNGMADFDPGPAMAILTASGSSNIFIAKYDAAGNYLWAKCLGGTLASVGLGLALDAAANLHVTGYYQGTVDFDPNAGTLNLTPFSGSDVYLAKYSTTGNVIWAKSIGGVAGSEYSRGLDVDGGGNILVSGNFSGTIDFDPSAGVVNRTALGTSDMFIAKYSAAGNYVWVTNEGGLGASHAAYFVTVAQNGNLATTGTFSATVDADPGAAISNLTSAMLSSVHVSTYLPNGNYVWAICTEDQTGGFDNGYSTQVDALGNIYVTGYFTGRVDFDHSVTTAFLVSNGQSDIYLAKYDPDGNYLWAVNMGGTDLDLGLALALDQTGNVFLTGKFRGVADFDPTVAVFNLTGMGWEDIFFAKYTPAGALVWARSMGGTGFDVGNAIAVNAAGEVFIAGSFTLTTDLDPSAGTVVATAAGLTDAFYAKYDAAGNYLWSHVVASVGDDNALGVTVDANGEMVVTGKFTATVDMDPGVGIASRTSIGLTDIFMAKYGTGGNLLWADAMGSTGADAPKSIALNIGGSIFLIGALAGNADMDPSAGVYTQAGGGLVARYDPSGAFQWSGVIGGSLLGLAVDAASNVIVVGYFVTFIDFDPGPGSVIGWAPGGNRAVFIAQCDQWKNYLAGQIIQGDPGNEEANAVAIAPDNSVIITGYFQKTVDFDPDAPNAPLTPRLSQDAFLAKYIRVGIPLPIELVAFSAACDKEAVTLGWTTASESNNDHFTVERSADGDAWETIGSVPGADNSQQTIDYTFIDMEVFDEVRYYRLKQTDYDGAYTYSLTVAVNGCGEKEVVRQWLIDAQGRVCSAWPAAHGSLAPGIYFVRSEYRDGSSSTKKVSFITP